MTENIDPARSGQMALVRSRDTKPELRVRRALHSAGLRYRLHAKRLLGKPDLLLPSRRTVIFVHGCFWHQHPDQTCPLARMPKTRRAFWEPKLSGNRRRHQRVKSSLEEAGWRVFEVWECQIKADRLFEFVSNIKAISAEKPLRRRQTCS